jgi:hypothetical protein
VRGRVAPRKRSCEPPLLGKRCSTLFLLMTSLQDAPSALDRLPPDQRAVLQMVLARNKSYDEIAQLLSIDRAAVRARALAAFDGLGPTTRVPAQRRALITDYLLGQLPPRVAEEVRGNLAGSASERAWARVVASELAPVSNKPLPEIPVTMVEPEAERRRGEETSTSPAAVAGVESAEPQGDAHAGEAAPFEAATGARPRSSRLGGAILLGAVAAAAIAAILIFVVFGVGGSSAKKNRPGTPVSRTSSTSARPLAQINLTSPNGGKAVGIAEVIKAGNATGLVIVAQGLAANTKHDAYAVWLYNSSSDAYRLGYVQQAVTSNGKLQTAGRLPANASHFKQIIVALQTGPANKPGTIVLQGALSGV